MTIRSVRAVRIIAGPHKGRAGNVVSVVSIPWLGNLWTLRVEVDVPFDQHHRTWVKAWSWQLVEDVPAPPSPRV